MFNFTRGIIIRFPFMAIHGKVYVAQIQQKYTRNTAQVKPVIVSNPGKYIGIKEVKCPLAYDWECVAAE